MKLYLLLRGLKIPMKLDRMQSLEFSGKTIENEETVFGDLIRTDDGKFFISCSAEVTSNYNEEETDLYSTEFYEVHGYSVQIHFELERE